MTEQLTTTVRSNGAPSVLVEDDVHASAGNPATMRVHVRNLGDGPRDISVTVIGLDDGWAPEPVVLRDVPADMTVSAEAGLVPGIGAVPGEYPFVVVVQALPVGAAQALPPAQPRPADQAPAAAQATTLVEAHLTVDAPSEVLLTVEPADSRMRLRRKVDVVLSNTGSEPVEVVLSTRTDAGLRLELSDRDVVVPARTTLRLTAQARNLRPQLLGHLNRRGFSVAAAGKQAPARFSGTITSRPLLSSGFMRVMSLLLIMAIWAGGLVVGLPWLTDRVTAQQTADPAAGAGTDPGAPGDSGDPADPGGADGADDPGGAGGDGAGGAAQEVEPTVRIGGVVTATDPAGVQVQISPASIIADAPGGGGGAGGMSSSAPVPVHAVLAAGLAAGPARDTDDAPLAKTSTRGVAIESTTSLATTRTTSTGDDGAWAFAGLSPNLNYLLTVSKPGYQTVRHVVSGAEAAAGLDVELVAGDGQLSGRVTGPDGAGAGGVDIVITDGTTTVTTSTTTSGSVGSWAVEGLSTPSTYLVTAQGNGLGAQSRLVTLAAGGTATADMALSNGVASLSGIVTGPDSLGFDSGVGGATVTASDGKTTRTASTVTSGMVGSYTLVDLPIPGSYEITVEADGYATQTLQLTLDAATSSSTLDVALRTANGAVQGRVTDTAGEPLTSAGITLHNDDNTYKTMVTGDGSFRLNGIAPGEYVVSATQFGHLTGYATVRASAGFATIVDLVLTEVEGDGLVSTSRIRGRVGDARTNGQLTCTGLAPGEACLVTVKLKAQALDGSPRDISVTADPNTEYLIPGAGEEGLLPGLYVLEVSAPGYEPSSIRVSVPMDATVTAGQVALYPSPSLMGTVLARVGSVPDGTCVIVVPSGTTVPAAGCSEVLDPAGAATCVIDAPARCGLTGVNGGYTITNIPSGSYSASVQSGDAEYVFTDAPTEISLLAGDVRRFDAVLHRLARISITTLISTGSSALVSASEAKVAAVLLLPDGTEVPQASGTANAQGLVQLTNLPAGAYRFDVSALTATTPVTTLTGKLEGVTLAHNQELSSQLVLTNTAQNFTGKLITRLSADSVTGVGSLPVKVTGIIGYTGATPVRHTVLVTSSSDGTITTQSTDSAAANYLPVVADTVDVAFAGATGSGGADDDFKAQTFQGVTVANTVTEMELQPVGQPFAGTITLVGAVASAANQLSAVKVEVLSSPPGAGPVTIAAVGTPSTAVSGRLVWSDLTQPEDPASAGGRMARPGAYSIRVSLAGFDPVVQSFTILPGGTMMVGPSVVTEVSVKLERFGDLRVAAYSDTCDVTDLSSCTPVPNPVMTLRGNGSQQTATAAPGQNSVDFGELPSGTYRVAIQAAGFVGGEKEITVDAGQNAITEPEVVLLAQYGSIAGGVTTQVGANSQNLAGVSITATRTNPQPGEVSFTTVSDTQGRYELAGTIDVPGLRGGTWEVTASLEGYADWSLPAVVVTMGATTSQNIALTLERVDFKVTVVKSLETGQGIDGLTVQLINSGASLRPTCTHAQSGTVPAESVPSAPGCAPLEVGEYLFEGVLPVQSVLEIDGSAQGHSRLSLAVSPVLGQNPWVVTVPLVTMTNTVRGTVSSQSGGGAPVILPGATVTLKDAAGAAVGTPMVSDANGIFVFEGLPDATYTLTSELTGYGSLTRTIAVRNGQVAVLDLVMFPVTRQVSVVVTADGSDLTGALVGLSTTTPGVSPASLAAQPLVRGAGNTYTTSFSQVPTGVWTATVTGAAGHPWTTTASVADDGANPVTVTAAVTEVAITLSASAPASGPDSLEVTIAGAPAGGPAITPQVVSVPVSSGTRTISLLAGAYTVTPSAAPPWVIAPTSIAVSAADRDVRAAFTLSQPPVTTTTTVTSTPATLTVGQTARFTATVTAPGVTGITGDVEFTLGGTALGTFAASGGKATTGDVLITEAMVDRPSVTLTAEYLGRAAGGGTAQLLTSEGAASVAVTKVATSVSGADATTVGLVATFSATVTPQVAGTMTFTSASAGPSATCTATVTASAPITCVKTLKAGSYPDFRATFTPSGTDHAASTSAQFTVTVAATPAPTPTPTPTEVP